MNIKKMNNIGIEKEAFSPKEQEKIALLLQENKLTCKENRVYNTDYFFFVFFALFITD